MAISTTGSVPLDSDWVEPPRTRRAARSGSLLIVALVGALVFGIWKFTQLGLFSAEDDVGYGLGVAGGVAILLLFSYPLRKHVRALHGLGKIKWWFRVHMTLGIVGPLLILLHSGFHVGSMNAAVALYSMLVVSASGVIGRFFYLRVYRDLSGEQTNLRQLQAQAGVDRSEASSTLHFAPTVEHRLQSFADDALAAKPGAMTHLRRLLVLPVRRWFAYRACVADLRVPLDEMARDCHWSSADLATQQRLARQLIRHYLKSVVRVAQFSAYERIFALWHVAHVPFVALLVISAVIHVIAVHAY